MSARTDAAWLVAAAFLVLASPFLVFVHHYQYGWMQREILLCWIVIAVPSLMAAAVARVWRHAATVALAGFIILSVDAQFAIFENGYTLAGSFALLVVVLAPFPAQATRALAAAGVVMFVTTLLLPASTAGARPPVEPSSGSSHLPPVVHLVLDGHIGIEGLDHVVGGAQLGGELRTFFQQRGFLLYGGAYSEHFDTVQSLGHELNFSAGRYVNDFHSTGGADYPWKLVRNAYFDDLIRKGYALTVYQSSFLDFCASERARATCHTYNHAGVTELQSTPLTALEKAFVILRMYLASTRSYRELRFQYGRLRNRLLSWGVSTPIWHDTPRTASPLVTLDIMRRIALDVSDSQRGDYIFAHLLAPHEPYVFNANCELISPMHWLTRIAGNFPGGAINTADSRNARYQSYTEQLRCVYSRLDDILDAMPPQLSDAIFIVQGDHGSRIAIAEPGAQGPSRSRIDSSDSYSTLFAVRAPNVGSAYDERMISIACLLETLVENDFSRSPAITACSSPPTVFEPGQSGRIEPRTLESFQ